MKITAIILFVFTSLLAKADEKGLYPVPYYKIGSHKPVADVPDGFCRIKGRIYKDQLPFRNGIISNLDGTFLCSPDSLGFYSMVIPITEKLIYYYFPGTSEIVLGNYDFKNQHELELDFYTVTNVEIMVVDKPVIYLYAKKSTDVQISVDFKGDLTFMYPRYDNGWQVNVSKQGIQNKTDQKYYPYLFWEGTTTDLGFVTTANGMEGYFIQTDSTISFLENTLSQLGLNQKEMTDFITFWGPQIEKHRYATIQFLVDEVYTNEIAGINVNPAPDAMRRIYLLFEGSEIELKQNFLTTPVLKSFEREGLTLVEWGGSEI
jgi:hypothetical protein